MHNRSFLSKLMAMAESRPRCATRRLALAGAFLAAGCATRGPHPHATEEGFEVAHAIGEAREELPGVVLSRRHFTLEGQLRVTLSATDSAAAERAMAEAFSIADSIEGLLGLHRPASEVNAINAAAGRMPVAVSPWTETIIAAALGWAERTDGAFDPTVGPVVELWGFGPREPTALPDERHLAEARAKVGWQKVRYDSAAHTVFLTEPGMKLDLRAAAKGFALDRMREAMTAAGATSGILDLGGDHLFFGPGTETHKDLWPVDLQDPYDPNHAFAMLEVPGGAVSTTTPYARSVELSGQRVGHLIDPRTGRPASGLASVTVYSRDALVSDILSTGLFILGHGEGCDVVDEWEEIGVVFVMEPDPGQRALVCVTPALRGHMKDLEPPFRPLQTEDR